MPPHVAERWGGPAAPMALHAHWAKPGRNTSTNHSQPHGEDTKPRPWNLCTRRASQANPGPASRDCKAGLATRRLRATAAKRAALAPHPGSGVRGHPQAPHSACTPPLKAPHACETNTTIRRMWIKTGEVWTVCFRRRRAKAGLGGDGEAPGAENHLESKPVHLRGDCGQATPPPRTLPRHVPAHASPAAASKPQQSR